MGLNINGTGVNSWEGTVIFDGTTVDYVNSDTTEVYESEPTMFIAAQNPSGRHAAAEASFGLGTFEAYNSTDHYQQNILFGNWKSSQSHGSMYPSDTVITVHYDKKYGTDAIGLLNIQLIDTGSAYETSISYSTANNPGYISGTGYSFTKIGFHDSYWQCYADLYIKEDRRP